MPGTRRRFEGELTSVTVPVFVIVAVKVVVGEAVTVTVWVLNSAVRSVACACWREQSIPCCGRNGGQEVRSTIGGPMPCWERRSLDGTQTWTVGMYY